ncbi:hypothetical protein NPIL_578111 [Nephila pilipes]|uniref:Uncharacterized protein n=1 Tax=Nephila pilipes TaxID=299642 RepID=A0A8X6TXF5_NEPPI|nr:hypothetical protein NPIL_578111 [Nephila pilipes]
MVSESNRSRLYKTDNLSECSESQLIAGTMDLFFLLYQKKGREASICTTPTGHHIHYRDISPIQSILMHRRCCLAETSTPEKKGRIGGWCEQHTNE